MNARKCFRASGNIASAMVFLLACFAGVLRAQSTESVAAGALPGHSEHGQFVVAPWFQLTHAPTSVAVVDLNQDGKPDLIATGSNSGKVTVYLGTGNGGFASGVEYAAGSQAESIAVADVDGDGRADVIVSDEVEGAIQVLMGSGDGKLQAAQSYAVGIGPAFVATGDFNGDGKTDVAVVARSGQFLAVLLNDGRGSFHKAVLSALHKASTSFTVADFNSDGHADLAVANADGTISVLLGTGNGTFRPLSDFRAETGVLSSIVSTDLDRDGKIDLAVTEPGKKQISILLGKGNGSFEPAASYAVGDNPVSVTVADVNGDGVADLTVVNQGSNSFSVLSGNGDGTFKDSLDYVAGNGPVAAVGGDFDGDGRMDLAVINNASHTVSVPLGNGDGTFQAARAYKAEFAPRAAASADLNGDKRPDLVVTNYCGSDSTCAKGGSVAVFLANENGVYQLSHSYAVGAGPVSVTLVDVDGDKNADIVALNREDKTVSVLLSKGDGSFQQPLTFSLAESPVAVATGDFNKDGKTDLAVIGDCGAAKCSLPGSLEILLGQGDGGFRNALTYSVGYAPVSLAVGDINQDKNLDIVVANSCGRDAFCKSAGTVSVLLGANGGKFAATTDIALGATPASIALGDLSGRGILDLAVSRSSDNTVATLRGNGDGSFQTPAAYSVGNMPGSLVIADFNGDGKPDVAVANVQDSTVSVLFGKGDGTLNSSAVFPVGFGPQSLTAVEGRQGGHASLVTTNSTAASTTPGTDITVLANIQPEADPSVTPSIAATLSTGPNPSTYGTVLVFTATVTGTTNATQPTGSVVFSDTSSAGTSNLTCEVPADLTLVQNAMTNSTATCTTTFVPIGTNQITATYVPGSDPTYVAAGPSTAITQTVNKGISLIALALTSGASPSTLGASLTFTATVTGGNGLAKPTGSVTFADGGNSLTCAVSGSTTLVVGTSNSAATCTISSLSGGSHSITASYVPGTDPNYAAAGPTTPAITQVVTKDTPTLALALTSGASTSAFGASLTFTAIVTGASGVALPTGSVTFADGGSSLTCAVSGSGTLVAGTGNSTATCTISSLSGGSHSITATYVPGTDPNYAAAGPTTPAITQTVTKAIPTIGVVLKTGTSPSTFGTGLTFVATVTGVTGQALPTGSVTFADGGNALTCGVSGSATLVAATGNSTASCTISSFTGGSHSITAIYVPGTDPNYSAAGPSTALLQSVTQATATLSLSSPGSSSVNQAVTITATVAPSTTTLPPSGKVTFTLSGGGTIAGCASAVSVDSVSHKANCTTSALVAGSDGILASYAGDPNFVVSAPATFNQTVNASTPMLMVTSSSSSSSVGQSVTFTAALTGVALTPVTPAGKILFFVNPQGTVSCSVTPMATVNVSTGGTAMFSTQALVAPADVITAAYCADTNFTVANPQPFTQTIGTAVAQTMLKSSNSTSSVNQTVTFTATVTGSGGAKQPTGSVTFKQGTTNLCSPAALSTTSPATATCSFAFNKLYAGPGGTAITAIYGGDSNYTGTPANITQIVQADSTALSLTPQPSSSSVNQTVVFTATLQPLFTAGTAVPSAGTISFADTTAGSPGTALVGTGCTNTFTTTPASLTFTCSTAFTVAGTRSVTATYTPAVTDPNFSTSAVTKQLVIGAAGTTITVTPDTASSMVNQPATFSATVTPSVSGSGTAVPQGSVTFIDSLAANPLCTVNLSSTGAVPNCIATLLVAGTHAITAKFTPTGGNFLTSTSSVLNQVVNQGSASVTVTTSPAASTVDQLVTFTATIAPTPAGATNPTGSVTFNYVMNGTTIVLCSTPQPVSTVKSVTTASCTAPLLSAGAPTITAIYTGDSNFTSPTPGTLMQTVSATGTTVTVAPVSSIEPSVNQPFSFSAAVTPSVSDRANGKTLTLPTGIVKVTDTTAGVDLCTLTLNSDGTVPVCDASLSSAGTHSITATFTSGDGNFVSSSTAKAVTQQVKQATTTISVASSSLTSVATQAVTYTATVTPAFPGTGPSGGVTFSLTQGTTVYACTAASSLPVNGSSPYAESCVISFGPAVNGPIVVTATYAGDANFITSTSTSITQTVENFTPAGTPGLITLTQGSLNAVNTNLTDPFNSAVIALSSKPLSGFVDPIAVTGCTVLAGNSGNDVTGLSCAPNTSPTTQTGVATVSVTPSAVVGNNYVVQLTISDTNVPTLTKLVNIRLDITNLAAQATVASVGTTTVTFSLATALAAGTTLSCGTVSIDFGNGTYGPPESLTEIGIQCSAITPSSAATNGEMFTINAGKTTTTATAKLATSGTIIAATLAGMPFLVLVSLLPGVKRRRKTSLRYLGLAILGVAAMHGIGCGSGGFTRNTPVTAVSGTYVIAIESTPATGTPSVVAVVPLLIGH